MRLLLIGEAQLKFKNNIINKKCFKKRLSTIASTKSNTFSKINSPTLNSQACDKSKVIKTKKFIFH